MKPEGAADKEAHDRRLEEEAHVRRLEEQAYDRQIGVRVSGVSRGISILEVVLRMIAIFGTLGSAVAMGTTHQTLPFSTQALIFQAQYDDMPALRFFVIANAIVCGYLVISLPLAIYQIIRSKAAKTRVLLMFLDTGMIALLSCGASSSAAIVYLAHKGNASANWVAICQQYENFCERITGSLIGSFGVVLIFLLLIPLSGFILSRRH